jgi:large conductance mechanosensitive channel
MWKEFKDFAIKGNMLDLAIGVIIGGAFGKIVESLVRDIIMPPITLITGGIDFSNKFLVLRPGKGGVWSFPTVEAAKQAEAVTLNFGNFVTLTINFLIVAWAVFLLVKTLHRLKVQKRNEPPAPAPPTKQELLLEEIRDLLKKRQL